MICSRCQVRYEQTKKTEKKQEVDLRHLCELCRDREKMPLIKLLDEALGKIVEETFARQVTKDSLTEMARQVAIEAFEASARQAELYGYRFVADRPPMNNLATELRELKAQVQ